MAARKHRPPATLAAVSFSCKYRTKKNAAPPATPTSLRSAGCTVDKQHHCTSASNSPHGQHPARLHCINMQPKDCKTFLGSGKPNLAENRAPPNGRKPALLKTAARLPKSDYTPLKRTTHIPSGIHILRCINIQPKDWQVFTENNKPHPPENCVHYNCRKPALPKTATRLQESYSTPLKRTIHIPSGTHILRCINIQPRDWETFLGSGKSNLQENCIPSNCRKPALPKIATRLRGLKTPHLLAATHLQNRATSLR